MDDNKLIIDMTFDIMNATSFTLELSGAIATDLYEKGWRKSSDIIEGYEDLQQQFFILDMECSRLEKSEWELTEENKKLKARIEELEDYEASILANDY